MADDIGILYSKIAKLDARTSKLEASQPFLEEMLERNTSSNEKLAESLQSIQVSMATINEHMAEQSKTIETMKQESVKANHELNERIGLLDKKIVEIDERGKFDIISYLKKEWPWIVTVLGLGAAYASQFVKF